MIIFLKKIVFCFLSKFEVLFEHSVIASMRIFHSQPEKLTQIRLLEAYVYVYIFILQQQQRNKNGNNRMWTLSKSRDKIKSRPQILRALSIGKILFEKNKQTQQNWNTKIKAAHTNKYKYTTNNSLTVQFLFDALGNCFSCALIFCPHFFSIIQFYLNIKCSAHKAKSLSITSLLLLYKLLL